MLPFVYLVSFYVQTTVGGYILVVMANIVTGMYRISVCCVVSCLVLSHERLVVGMYEISGVSECGVSFSNLHLQYSKFLKKLYFNYMYFVLLISDNTHETGSEIFVTGNDFYMGRFMCF